MFSSGTSTSPTNERPCFIPMPRRSMKKATSTRIEIYLLCVALGFQGELVYHERRLAQWVQRTYDRVAAREFPARPFPEDRVVPSPFGPLRGPGLLLTTSVLASITALLTLAAYLIAVHLDYFNFLNRRQGLSQSPPDSGNLIGIDREGKERPVASGNSSVPIECRAALVHDHLRDHRRYCRRLPLDLVQASAPMDPGRLHRGSGPPGRLFRDQGEGGRP